MQYDIIQIEKYLKEKILMRVFKKDTIIIDSVTELSIQEAVQFKKNGYNNVIIIAESHPNTDEFDGKHSIAGYWQHDPYDIDTYIAVRMKLEELTGNIKPEESEEKKFAIVYERICKNITYDYPAAYPKTNREREYHKSQLFNSRDLTNGLLDGKCVCAGYACILQAALQLVGIDARYISRTYSRR